MVPGPLSLAHNSSIIFIAQQPTSFNSSHCNGERKRCLPCPNEAPTGSGCIKRSRVTSSSDEAAGHRGDMEQHDDDMMKEVGPLVMGYANSGAPPSSQPHHYVQSPFITAAFHQHTTLSLPWAAYMRSACLLSLKGFAGLVHSNGIDHLKTLWSM